MARGRSIVEAQDQQALSADPDATPVDVGFGAEFRELARQRRFVRSGDEAATPVPPSPASSPATDWRAQAAPPSRKRQAPAHPADPASTSPMLPVMPALPDAPAHRSSRPPEPRISDDQRATLRELARMSDRLVQSREDLATITAHAAQLEASVASSTEQLAAADQRLLASRVLVQDAQRATHELSERCVWLESRCETLQEALELAVNASWITRWSWRREQRARARA